MTKPNHAAPHGARAAPEWGTHEKSPDVVWMPLRAGGAPIDRYSDEQVELLRDFVRVRQHLRGPDGQLLMGEFYAIDVNFDAIADPEEKRCFRKPADGLRAERPAGRSRA